MSKQLRLGILGAARNVPFSVLVPIKENSDLSEKITIVGIASLQKTEAEAAAKEWGIPKAFASYEELLADPSIDAVYNATPFGVRCSWSVKALQAGKHVLSETPIGCNALEAVALQRAAEDAGKVMLQGTHPTCHPVTKRVRELILDNKIGGVEMIEMKLPVAHGLGGALVCGKTGATMSLGVHAAAIVRTLSGEDARVVHAVASKSKDDPNIDIEMRCELVMPSGAQAKLHLSVAESSKKTPSIFTITGCNGIIRCKEFFSGSGKSSNEIQLEQFEGVGEQWTEFVDNDIKRDTFYYQLKTFNDEITEQANRQKSARTKDGVPGFPWHYTKCPGPVDAVRNLALVDCIYRTAGMTPKQSTTPPPAPYNIIAVAKL
mmetsp:Transcript_26439/g.69850  ORF Transcript_26439/g.69850 Transcript_26439/m.69850 type:complete len:376 (-) Transcript_26439:77-1204(-)